MDVDEVIMDATLQPRKRRSNLDVSQVVAGSRFAGTDAEMFSESSVLGILMEAGWDVRDFEQATKKKKMASLSHISTAGMLCAECLGAPMDACTLWCGHP